MWRSKMRKSRARIAIVLIMFLIVAGVGNNKVLSVQAAVVYNPQKAIEYAAAHWNDGVGKCATFVSNCVIAGGIDMKVNSVTDPMMTAICNATGLSIQDLKLNSSGHATRSANEGKLAAGDVVGLYCVTCGYTPHVIFCGGFDSSGRALYYAHNKPKNMELFPIKASSLASTHSGHKVVGKVIHLSGLPLAKEQYYTLYLDPNQGRFADGSVTTIKMDPQLIYGGGHWWDVSSHIPTKEGYFFNGWFTEPVGGTRVYDYEGKACNEGLYFSNNTYVYPGDLTVYAQWSKYYDLYLDPNGGSFSNGTTEVKKASPQLIYEGGHWWDVSGHTPTKEGCTFEGWFSQPNGGIKIYNADGTACNEGQYFRDNLYVNQGDLKVYAQWSGSEIPFPDVKPGAWYYNSVAAVYEAGLMNGRADGTFGPNLNLTRAEVATVLYNKENKPYVAYVNCFSDVKDGMWYSAPISWAYRKGIASGYGNGKFGVGDNISREQMAQMLYAYAKMKGYDVSYTDGAINQYGDSSKVSSWAKPAMNWAISKGIMSGKGSGSDLSKYKLEPQGSTTRAECAAMLKNFMDTYGR